MKRASSKEQGFTSPSRNSPQQQLSMINFTSVEQEASVPEVLLRQIGLWGMSPYTYNVIPAPKGELPAVSHVLQIVQRVSPDTAQLCFKKIPASTIEVLGSFLWGRLRGVRLVFLQSYIPSAILLKVALCEGFSGSSIHVRESSWCSSSHRTWCCATAAPNCVYRLSNPRSCTQTSKSVAGPFVIQMNSDERSSGLENPCFGWQEPVGTADQGISTGKWKDVNSPCAPPHAPWQTRSTWDKIVEKK